MTALQNVFQKIDGYREEIIELQRELTSKVALGPENGGSGEQAKANYLKEKLVALNPDLLEEVNAPDERTEEGSRPNLVARWEGVEAEHTVWVLSHMDIVPPGDLSLWEGDPFQIKVESDRITGRGVLDNQHGIVSSYLALKAVHETGGRPKKPYGLVFVSDEETGSKFGLDYVLKKKGGLFKHDDLIVVPDSGNPDGTVIEVAEKSMLWLKFTVIGKQCHASTPVMGRNSLQGAARLIVALESLKEKFSTVDELFSPPVSTFEPTKIEANVPNVNTIPGRDVFYVDCRILPKYRVDEILEYAQTVAEDVGKDLRLSVQVEQVYRQEAINPTSSSAPVVNALGKAIKAVTGREASAIGIGGGTVAAFFRKAGLPAAVWMTMQDSAHQPNEYCFISDIMCDAKVLAYLFMH